ncbi:hypothetical protein DAEQUDRAFT_709663 [Daedalea quercina L-15889]|uniref:F-box domain-containing protein n=1 Tax=Daedalea quercina L-15889 TaxID=1314783 RepID=A0A165QSG3_9APHY|nr:hypothetical protein DAEQUDRAFT_709663 [Daedalea quercina L-15889]
MVQSPCAGIHQLPYDILIQLSSLLTATDIVHLLSTCRALHPLAYDEHVWKDLSRRVGVYDVGGFGGRSFRTVYTGLLHAYIPLLGLWAGDHPFSGQILEFRLDLGGEGRPPGIVGVVWRFRSLEPEEFDDPSAVQLPTRIPIIRIGFSDDHAVEGLPDEGRRIDQAVPYCSVGNDKRQPHAMQLTVEPETTEGIFLHTRYGQFQHPAFPHPSWHDRTHPFPKAATPSAILPAAEPNTLTAASRPPVPICFKATADYVSSRAISISCARGCHERLSPFLGFKNCIRDHPRYYPLRMCEIPSAMPSDDWTPAHLAGLWLGTYGPHGTECLFLTYDETRRSLRAVKVTGDENVPRGSTSWDVSTVEQCQYTSSESELWSRAIGGAIPGHAFRGFGTISARGFMPHQITQFAVILTVIGPHELRLLWLDDGDVLGLIRYNQHAAVYSDSTGPAT